MDFSGSMTMQGQGLEAVSPYDQPAGKLDGDEDESFLAFMQGGMKPAQPVFELPSAAIVAETHQRLMSNGITRTPLIRLKQDCFLMEDSQCPQRIEIYLKLECEQHCRTFKSRGALNYLLTTPPEQLQHGLVTPSVGSFGQALAYFAKNTLGNIPHCSVLLPTDMDRYRGQLLENVYGARVLKLAFNDWWSSLENRTLPPGVVPENDPINSAHFIHPASTACGAGDATVALEILEELPDVDTIVVPFCTGSFSSSVSHFLKEAKPSVKVLAAEVSTSTPLHTAMSAGAPARCQHTATFSDQIGGQNVLLNMWPVVQEAGLLDSLVVTQEQIVQAISVLKNDHDVTAEGAGATPLAAAMAGKAGAGKVCCVVTGGNIDPEFLTMVMRGQVPQPRFT